MSNQCVLINLTSANFHEKLSAIFFSHIQAILYLCLLCVVCVGLIFMGAVQCAASHKRANAYQQSFYRCFTESTRYFSLDCTGFVAPSWSQWTLVLWCNNTGNMSHFVGLKGLGLGFAWVLKFLAPSKHFSLSLSPQNHIYWFSLTIFT